MGNGSSKCASQKQQQHRLSPSITTLAALGTEERQASNISLPPEQQQLFQVWPFSREHKNPSNDCKPVAGPCKQLWGHNHGAHWALDSGTWGCSARGGFDPLAPRASRP